jgi:hypothetical protein
MLDGMLDGYRLAIHLSRSNGEGLRQSIDYDPDMLDGMLDEYRLAIHCSRRGIPG